MSELLPVKFDITTAALKKLEKESKAFSVPTSPKESRELAEQIALVRTTRTSIEKRRKAKNAPVLAWQRELKSLADSLIEKLKSIESPLVDLKKEYDDEKDRERREKAEAEAVRIQAINDKISMLHGFRDGITLSHTSDQISELIEQVASFAIDEDHFQELELSARAAKAETLRFLTARLNEVKQREAEDEQRRIDQIEIDRVRKEQEDRQAKLDEQQRGIDEALEKAKLVERERQEKIEREERAEQEKIDAVERERIRALDEDARIKLAAAAKRKKAAYRKKLEMDLPMLEAYVKALSGITPPKPVTDDCKELIESTTEFFDDLTIELKALAEA